MQSWILAFALVFAAGTAAAEDVRPPAAAEEVRALEPETVPPIPAPEQRMQPVAPLAGPWPAAPGETTVAEIVVDESGAPVALPPIPAPLQADAEKPEAELASAPAPRVRPPFDPNGTVHVVETGDTLWDISDLYLGTPWIWPSIWKDNDEIENPHLILPGDKIWVSATEMRKISDEEAAALLAAANAKTEEAPVPAALAEDMPAVPMPEPPREIFQYMEMATVGVVTRRELKGYARVVGTTSEAILMAQGHVVFVDLGDQDASVGDEFVLFRTAEKVYDPSSRRVIGHHSEVVGWVEIMEVYEESARAKIRMSYSDFMPSEAYLKPREAVPTEIAVLDSPQGVEGQIVDLLIDPKYRGGGDVIILNRGSKHGLQAGSPLEIYRSVSDTWKNTWYGGEPDVEIPHEVVADVLVLTVQPKTAMAYIRKTKANTEVQYGDRFRTVDGPSVEWPRGGIFAIPLRVLDVFARIPRPDVDMPDIYMPDEVAGWEVPRLPLPNLGLDAYDPR